MSKDCDHEEDEELLEIQEALIEGCVHAAEDDPDDGDGFLVFYRTKDRKTIHIRSSEGRFASIPTEEFDEVLKNVDMPCLICGGSLDLVFEYEHRPPLYLTCNKCEAPHRVLHGALFLSD